MGIGESIKGAIKQKTGDLVDDDNLQAEGEAQKQKGEEETEATKAQAEAKAHEKKADALENEQQGLEQ